MGLDLSGFGAVADLVNKIISPFLSFIPDPKAKEAAQAAALAGANEIAQKVADYAQAQSMAEIELLKAQIETNNVQAASPNFFVAGARPALMWVCVAGVAYQALVYPLILWVNAIFKFTESVPALDGAILTMMIPLFGIPAVLRTAEKFAGKASPDLLTSPAPRATIVIK